MDEESQAPPYLMCLSCRFYKAGNNACSNVEKQKEEFTRKMLNDKEDDNDFICFKSPIMNNPAEFFIWVHENNDPEIIQICKTLTGTDVLDQIDEVLVEDLKAASPKMKKYIHGYYNLLFLVHEHTDLLDDDDNNEMEDGSRVKIVDKITEIIDKSQTDDSDRVRIKIDFD